MIRQVLKFADDTPQVLSLDKGPEGRATTSKKSGETEYQYTCNGNTAVMWLPAAARVALMRTNAQAGDTVEIVKTSRGVWMAQVLADPAPEPARPGPQAVPRIAAATSGANALKPQPQPARVPTSYPIVERMTRMFVASAQSLRAAHEQLAADPYWAELEKPTWEDVRVVAIHWAITLEKREGQR